MLEAGGAPRDDLVDVGLMAGVPQEDVAWRVEHPVQGERELHSAEVGAEVAAAGSRHDIDDELTDLCGQLIELGVGQASQIGR